MPQVDPARMNLAQLMQHVEVTIRSVAEASTSAASGILNCDKRLDLPGGAYLVLPGRLYVEGWLVANFYFVLVMALRPRHASVRIGKADYMAHVAPHVRMAGQG